LNPRLLVGRLRDAWLEYPGVRQRIAAAPAGPPIFLTGTHRSGTTWLAKMLAASGIWYVHEPFSPQKGRWPRSFEYRQIEHPNPAVDALFEDVLAGGFREALNLPNADHPLMPLRVFRPKFQRLLIKDPLACLLTEYLTRRFNLQTLILFRHPAGFVSSVCRLGWPRGAFLRQLLADDALMAAHLEPHRSLLERYAQEDSIASASVLHGALSSVLWRFVQDGIGTAVQFEVLCSDPLEQLKHLFWQLGLPYSDEVRESHRHSCFGTPQSIDSYHPHAVNRNSMAMASAWKTQIRSTELQQIRGIWEQFDVPLYRERIDWDPRENAEISGVVR